LDRIVQALTLLTTLACLDLGLACAYEAGFVRIRNKGLAQDTTLLGLIRC